MNRPTPRDDYFYSSGEIRPHHRYLLKPLLTMMAASSMAPEMMRVLDLGCGNGSLSRTLAEQGYQVVGIDISVSGVHTARQATSKCRFIEASLYNLPFEELEHQFDVVIAVEVIEHLFYPRELLRTARRCLKPGGRLILTTPYHGYGKNLAIALLNKFDYHFNPLKDGGHIKFFSVNTLSHLLKQEKFSQIQYQFAGRLPFFWKSMVCSSTVNPE